MSSVYNRVSSTNRSLKPFKTEFKLTGLLQWFLRLNNPFVHLPDDDDDSLCMPLSHLLILLAIYESWLKAISLLLKRLQPLFNHAFVVFVTSHSCMRNTIDRTIHSALFLLLLKLLVSSMFLVPLLLLSLRLSNFITYLSYSQTSSQAQNKADYST
jgi:hypothetical protein